MTAERKDVWNGADMPRNSEVRAAVDTLRAAGAASTDAKLKSRLKTTERLFLALVRQVDYEKRRGAAEVKALRSELHDELIAREAAAARIAERQRAAFDATTALPESVKALESAVAGSALVETAVRALDLYALKNIGETAELVADVGARK